MKIKSIPNEYLQNNIIDKEFQAVLLPFRILQSFFLILRFRILNNFITPEVNTSCYIKSVLGSTTLVLSYFIRYLFYIGTVQDFGNGIDGVVIFLLHFDVSFYSLVSVMIYIDSVLKRNYVVELIIKLQKVVNTIKVDKKAFFFKHKIHNWFCVLLLVSMYVVDWLISTDDFGFLSLLVSFTVTVSMLFFDINILNVICTIVMIKNLLVAWTRAMREYKKDNIQAEGEIPEKAMFNAYVDIIGAFHLCRKVYQFSFMYFAFETFIYTLITVESVIEFSRSSSDESLYHSSVRTVLTVLWNIKNFILIATLSVACDNFYRTIKLAESACTQILSDDQAGGMRKTCKNVMRLNRAVPQKLSAFGVFEIDAAYPLRLLGGIVTYTVVLLQFAFL